MQLVKYHTDTGQIDGIYDSALPSLLEAQIVPDDPTYGYVYPETPIPLDAQHRYEVAGGALAEKQPLTIEADPQLFAADGIDECLVTVEPWQACTLLINAGAYALTEDEPMLVITSNVPQIFTISLAPMPHFWAEPLRVEAIAHATT